MRYGAQHIRDVCAQMRRRESRGIYKQFIDGVFDPTFFGVIAKLLAQPSWPCPTFIDGQYEMFQPSHLKFRMMLVNLRHQWFDRLPESRKQQCFVYSDLFNDNSADQA